MYLLNLILRFGFCIKKWCEALSEGMLIDPCPKRMTHPLKIKETKGIKLRRNEALAYPYRTGLFSFGYLMSRYFKFWVFSLPQSEGFYSSTPPTQLCNRVSSNVHCARANQSSHSRALSLSTLAKAFALHEPSLSLGLAKASASARVGIA